MSSPSSSAEQSKPKRPGHGSRHGSSWISRLHRHHDRKHHAEEQEPLLAEDQPDSDVEAQEIPPEPQSQSRGWDSAIKRDFDKVTQALKSFVNVTSRNWKQILIACVLTLLTVLISLLVGFYLRHKDKEEMSVAVCTSAACVHAASGILYNLDPAYAQIASFKGFSNAASFDTASFNYFDLVAKNLSTDACTNFDKLVCGGFEDRHDLRPDQSSLFTGTLMVEESQTVLRHILEGDVSKIPSSDRPNFEKLKADYDACMDEKTIQDQGLEPLKEITECVMTFFAAPEAAWKVSPVRSYTGRQTQQEIAHSSTSKLTDALLYLSKLGIDGMISAGVGVSLHITTQMT